LIRTCLSTVSIETNPRSRPVAKALLRNLAKQRDAVLLWQVAGEFLRQLNAWQRRGLLSWPDVERLMRSCRLQFPIVLPVCESLDRAIIYANKFELSHWDSMIVAACAEAGATTLYTEDMGAPRNIDGIQLVNPF
jgi:predicted nucleic acid-binding protein